MSCIQDCHHANSILANRLRTSLLESILVCPSSLRTSSRQTPKVEGPARPVSHTESNCAGSKGSCLGWAPPTAESTDCLPCRSWYFLFTVVVVAAVVVVVEVDVRLCVMTPAEGTTGYRLGEPIPLCIYVIDDLMAGYLDGDSAHDLGPTDASNSRDTECPGSL